MLKLLEKSMGVRLFDRATRGIYLTDAGRDEVPAVPHRNRWQDLSGKFTGTVQLSSGKFAAMERSHEFTQVPWRPARPRG